MTFISAILAGVLFGISSYLPCSSSGFLYILHDAFNVDCAGYAVSAMCELGVLLAGIFYCRSSYHFLLRQLQEAEPASKKRRKRRQYRQLTLNIRLFAASLPFIFALLLRNFADSVGNNMLLIAMFAAISGFIAYRVTLHARNNGNVSELSVLDFVLIGIFQILSVIPGMSRIGLAVYGGTVKKLQKETAMHLALVLAVPTIALSFFYHILMMITTGFALPSMICCIFLVIASFIAAIGALRLYRLFIAKYDYAFFSYFNWGLAIVVLVLALVV